MKKLFIILLALAMALALIGCGGTENGGSSEPPANSQEVSTPDNDGGIASPGGGQIVAECAFDEGEMSLKLPEGWEYELDMAGAADGTGYEKGIVFWPAGEPELKLTLGFRSVPVGICGTGVTFTDTEFANGLTATACTEELDGTLWYLLIYDYQQGVFTVESNSEAGLWEQYDNEITGILDTVFLTVYR